MGAQRPGSHRNQRRVATASRPTVCPFERCRMKRSQSASRLGNRPAWRARSERASCPVNQAQGAQRDVSARRRSVVARETRLTDGRSRPCCATILAMSDFTVVVGAGTLRSAAPDAVSFPHRWTTGGVTVDASFTGAHLLHLAAAGCVLNDIYREAEALGVMVSGVRVSASGDFETDSWRSTGIGYSVKSTPPRLWVRSTHCSSVSTLSRRFRRLSGPAREWSASTSSRRP